MVPASHPVRGFTAVRSVLILALAVLLVNLAAKSASRLVTVFLGLCEAYGEDPRAQGASRQVGKRRKFYTTHCIGMHNYEYP